MSVRPQQTLSYYSSCHFYKDEQNYTKIYTLIQTTTVNKLWKLWNKILRRFWETVVFAGCIFSHPVVKKQVNANSADIWRLYSNLLTYTTDYRVKLSKEQQRWIKRTFHWRIDRGKTAHGPITRRPLLRRKPSELKPLIHIPSISSFRKLTVLLILVTSPSSSTCR